MRAVGIEARGLDFSYPDGQAALRGVSFAAAPGECIGLVGPNGAGKSTLLLLLVGILFPARGDVLIDGEALTKRALATARRRIGFAFQDPDDLLFMTTVGEDVAFGPRNMGLPEAEVAQRVAEALSTVGIEHLADRPPFRLSGGEKRAAAIATVLSMGPEAIILDEPSASLDARSRRRLIDLLAGLPHTRIVAPHDIDLAHELCDRVVVLSEGRVEAEGPTDAMLGDEALMERVGLERPRALVSCPRCGASAAAATAAAAAVLGPAAQGTAPLSAERAAKLEALRAAMRAAGKAAIAFSGGTDSSLLCAIAAAELGGRALAVTIASPLLPASELSDARAIARSAGIEHLVIEEDGIEEAVAHNAPDRCYHCKKREFAAIAAAARERGFETVLDGSNADDERDYRPGSRALAELGIMSPLREARMTKEDVRAISRHLGLRTWDKPAFACLASRVPYGDRIDAALLRRVEAAEDYLRGLGFKQVRVRAHGSVARIELAPEERRGLYSESLMDRAAEKMRELGFDYACMELGGYERGSLNRAIAGERKA